jgi:hypothetical protein
MRPSKLPALAAIAAVLAVGLVAVWWPRSETIPGPPLSAEQIRTCPDRDVIDRVINRLSQRAGQMPSGWHRLPEAARTVYVVRAFILSCSRYCLADQAVASAAFPGAPSPADTAAAFRALNLGEIARVLDIVDERMRSTDPALAAWIAYRSAGEGASPIPPNPCADLDARLHAALIPAETEAVLRAFIRATAEAIADP